MCVGVVWSVVVDWWYVWWGINVDCRLGHVAGHVSSYAMWVWHVVVAGREGRAYSCRRCRYVSKCGWHTGVLSIGVGTIEVLAECRWRSHILSE